MTSRRFRFPAFVALALAALASTSGAAVPQTCVLIVVGPSSHAPGTHEPAAGARLLRYCLERAPQPGGLHAQVYHEWPADEAVLDAADTIVFLGDRFPPMRLPDSERILQKLAAMMARGCGLVGLHFATGLRGDEVAADGEHPLLRWMGGYFLTAPATNRSIARVLNATISPGQRTHPVQRGWREFELRDEPYFRNFFGPGGMAPNVTPLATALLPPEEPRREIVAWAVERADGGRGVAVVMPHFYRNWQLDDLRTFILNAVVWSAKREVPDNGVQVTLPDPATFWPAAVEPLTPAQKAAPRPVTERRIELDAKPLHPAANPLFTEYVNRDRVYDFYEKQALDTLHRPDRPALLPPWPGLDGAKTRRSRRPGHFGNQTTAMAVSDAWNQMDGGSVQAGGMELERPRPRAVAVRLGDQAAVFDPDTLTWPAAFRGAALKRGTTRFGFTEGLQIEGGAIPLPPTAPAPPGSFRYLGYYRHGDRAVFAYERDGLEWLEAAVSEADGVAIRRERRGEGPLTGLTRGGPAQWPQTFVTRGKPGDAQPYAFDELPPPTKTPWNSIWHFGGHDFLPNGDAVLCTIEGEVWVVSGLDDTLARLQWRRFAAGLNQPLGLRVVDGRVCILGRDQITRLHDLNGDGEADYYESLCHTYDSSATGHAFITDLQRDREGRFIFVSGRQGVVRTSTDMTSVEVLATGLRNPNGVGLGPGGEISVAPQEGFWTPASMIYEFQPEPQAPPHFGFGGPKPELGERANVPPLVYFPRGEDNSSGGQCYVEGDRWGVPAGTLVHFSWGMGTAFLVLRERSGAVAQGTIVPLPGNFRSGAHRGRFRPQDGQLYVTGMAGWVTYTPDTGSFTRVRYTGGPVQVPRATTAHENGVLLRFAEAVDAQAVRDVRRFFAQQWSYRYTKAYGSDEYSIRSPEQAGHDVLEITSTHLLADGRSVFLEIPQLQPSNVLHVHCELPGLLARTFYLTLHRLGPAFTDFPGYTAVPRIPLDPHAGHHAPAAVNPASLPVPWEQGEAGRTVTLQAFPALKFDQAELRCRAGERLSLTLENRDDMPHNWVLVADGAAERIGALADEMITTPDAFSRHYVPNSPDILCHTRIVEARESSTIHFTAPRQPGRYPYLCTLPGHWSVMRGVLIVE